MRRTRYCYSHKRAHGQKVRKIAERTRQRWFESEPLRDSESVQRALMRVLNRLLSGEIDHKHAGQIITKLQSASANNRQIPSGTPNK
ncbi:MAG TPA: hypothetical protein VGN39_01095 [Terriglobales bacterium]|nr:hypothetical protein [Terriglobales bacterium]